MKFLYSLPALLLFLWLSACSTSAVRYEPVAIGDWQHYQQILNKIQQWTIQGRISVQTEDDGGQADYTWKQYNSTDYDISLQAPMGAGTMLISGRQSGVNLKTSSGDELFDTDVDKLMLRLNGWPLPVSGLYYWVRGLPVPETKYEVVHWNDNGLPYVMLQNGWRIEFRKYKNVGGDLLPGKLFISREDNEEIEVRLIIRQWNVDERGGNA